MRKLMLGLAVAAVTLAGTAYAQDKKFTIGVSIPAADHGWTSGVVFHAERIAKKLMEQHPGLNVIVKTSPDAASQANAVQDLDTQGIDALVILPSDPDPLVNAIKEVKGKGKYVALVDRAPSTNDDTVRDLYVAGNNPALGEVAGKYIAAQTPDAEVVATFQNLTNNLRGVGVRLEESSYQLGRTLMLDRALTDSDRALTDRDSA